MGCGATPGTTPQAEHDKAAAAAPAAEPAKPAAKEEPAGGAAPAPAAAPKEETGGTAAPAPAAAPAAEPAAAAPAASKKKELAGDESMEMYFQELKAFTIDEMGDLEEIDGLQAKGAESAKALVLKQTDMKSKRTAFKVKADRLLKECFEAGDVSGDGFLSKEESARVFAKITDANADYLAIIAKEETRRILASELGVSRKVFETIDVQDEEAIIKKLEEQSKEEARRNAASIDQGMKDALESYKAEKKGRDEAAFKVLDKSGDGKISTKEFINAFDTTSDTYEQFLTALGLFDAPAAAAAPAAEM